MGSPVDAGVLRLMDANANRVREGLRVMEDCARFVWNDRELTGDLKALRHDFAAALQALEAEVGPLVAHRDTPADVGTGLTTDSEESRSDIEALVVANAKRVQEGLRSLEEGIKLLALAGENPFKPLRYRAYSLERAMFDRHPETFAGSRP